MRHALIAILLVVALPSTAALAGRRKADQSKDVSSVTRQLEDAGKKVRKDVKPADLQKQADAATRAARGELDKLNKNKTKKSKRRR